MKMLARGGRMDGGARAARRAERAAPHVSVRVPAGCDAAASCSVATLLYLQLVKEASVAPMLQRQHQRLVPPELLHVRPLKDRGRKRQHVV